MTRTPPPLLYTQNLSIATNQNQRILENINIHIPQSQITALTGPSASGKTTLARALSGLLPQNMRITSGQIYYQNKPITYPNLQKRTGHQIFYTPQNAAASLNPVLKIKHQILETAKIPHSELLEILETLDFPDPHLILNAYPFQLSGGENRRCLLALALAHKPELLILDEPTASLDHHLQQELTTLIQQTQNRYNQTILLITHNIKNFHPFTHTVYNIEKNR